MNIKPFYFDNNATTPMDKRVLDAILPFFMDHFGNASSTAHLYGSFAKHAVEVAREQVAGFIHSEPGEIIFTSGSTESVNIALKGVWNTYKHKGNHIITVKTEHAAVLETCHYLQEQGAQITYLEVDAEGVIDLEEFKKSISKNTICVAVMHANNETGVIQPIQELAEIAHSNEAIFFCDATQSAGKLMIDVHDLGVDLMCLSAHKFHGPKGSGALYVRRKNPRVRLSEFIHGGGHEQAIRSGTLNVPGIVGLGKACEVAGNELWDNNTHVSKIRAYLEHQLLDLDGLRINGSTRNRLYNTSNLCFSGQQSAALIGAWNIKFSVSTGAACSTASTKPSHVLTAMGMSKEDVNSSIRFSFSKYNTMEEVQEAVNLIHATCAPAASQVK